MKGDFSAWNRFFEDTTRPDDLSITGLSGPFAFSMFLSYKVNPFEKQYLLSEEQFIFKGRTVTPPLSRSYFSNFWFLLIIYMLSRTYCTTQRVLLYSVLFFLAKCCQSWVGLPVLKTTNDRVLIRFQASLASCHGTKNSFAKRRRTWSQVLR